MKQSQIKFMDEINWEEIEYVVVAPVAKLNESMARLPASMVAVVIDNRPNRGIVGYPDADFYYTGAFYVAKGDVTFTGVHWDDCRPSAQSAP